MRVFSVPVSVPFLRTVIAALVDGRLVDGLRGALAIRSDWRRRRCTCRPGAPGGMAREMFLDELKTDAAVLPRIVALGDIDEDELAFAEEAEQFGGAAPLDIPPKLGELERRLTLAQTGRSMGQEPGVGAARGRRSGIDPCAGRRSRAADGRHGDARRRMGRARRPGAGPARQILAVFTRIPAIARQAWPAHLQEIGKIEPAARRDLLIEAEAKRLTAHHEGPVIAAGSTGSMPATAKFLHAVAGLPQGAVVLPGLDTDLDDDAWQVIGGIRNAQGRFTTHPASNHPQYAMHALLSGSESSAAMSKSSASLRPTAATCCSPRRCGLPTRRSTGMRRLAEPDIAAKIALGMTDLAVIEARQSRDGSAGDRDRDARGAASRKIGSAGDA